MPKLAGKVVQWLDLKPDDKVLDIGCGGTFLLADANNDVILILTRTPDGILNADFAKVLAQGSGHVHGIDSSPAMIEAAKELCKDSPNATFEGENLYMHRPLLTDRFR